MKIVIANRRTRQGSVLFVSLGLATLLILFMFYFLSLVLAQNTSVVRSQAWNGALALAEAGVEEALAQLNSGVNPMVNGWTQSGDAGGYYGPGPRTLSPGSTYDVIYSASAPLTPLSIFSTGYVTVPALSATLKRTVVVVVTNTPFFSVALAARYGIKMNDGGDDSRMSTDSYDSSSPSLSNGHYDKNMASTNGDVASVYGPVDPGNLTIIKGDLYLGPTASYSGGANSYSGTKYSDFNVDFPEVALPSTNWLAAPSGLSIDGTNYDHAFLINGNYEVHDPSSVYVGTNITVRLKITAGIFSGTIRVAGDFANSGKLTIYMAGASFSSDGQIDSGRPENLSYFGLASNTSVTWRVNTEFIGTIYAPSADLTLIGGGHAADSPTDFSGSSVTRTVTMNGHFKFHFDKNLLKVGPMRGYLATSWREI